MDGNLLTLHEAAAYLFGEDTVATYKRTWRLIKSNDVPTIKTGKKIYVARAVLDDACRNFWCTRCGQGLRDSAGPVRDQKGDSGRARPAGNPLSSSGDRNRPKIDTDIPYQKVAACLNING